MGKRPTRKFAAAERQIKLALYVQEHAPVTRTQIQNDLPDYAPKHKGPGDASSKEEATARRRFERDKEELARMGITLNVNNLGFYSVGEPKSNPFSRCNPESREAALLRAAASALLQDPSFVHASQLRMALAKLSAQLEIPDTLTWASKNSLEALRAESASLNGIRIKTAQALENKKLLSFDYQDAHGKQSRRNVEPIGMYVSGSFEYLAAWDIAADGKRSFRLDRMGKASVKDSGRGNPDYEPRPFNLSEWQILPFQLGKPEELVQATVAIDKDASWQARHLCSGYGSITALEDGSSLWNVSCADPNRLAEWCISNGPGLVPQEPQEACDAYRRVLEAAANLAPGAKLPGQNGVLAFATAALKTNALAPTEASAPNAITARPVADKAASHAKRGSARTTVPTSLAKNELLFACLALLELTGSVSIPQAARMLGTSEDDIYNALEALAFCYDAVNVRLGLGERGCSFATLKTPCGLSFSLSKEEQEALTEARAIFFEDDVARIISTACTIEGSQRFIIEYWKEGTPAPEERIIEPQAMLVQNEHHYVQAWCHKVRAQRLFRLDRIISAVPLAADGSQQAPETPELKIDSSENRSATKRRESQRPVKAQIVLKPETRVPDWPGLRKAKKQPADGSISFSVPWFESPWLAKQLASMGACVNKVEPAELACAAASYAASLL